MQAHRLFIKNTHTTMATTAPKQVWIWCDHLIIFQKPPNLHWNWKLSILGVFSIPRIRLHHVLNVFLWLLGKPFEHRPLDWSLTATDLQSFYLLYRHQKSTVHSATDPHSLKTSCGIIQLSTSVLKNVCSRTERCKQFSQQELLHTINKQLREEATNNPM
jgi:hypothetical protein